MLVLSIIALAFTATSFAQVAVPATYRKVYLTSMVDPKYVISAKGLTSGSGVVVNTVSNKPDQHFLLQPNASKIYLANTEPPTLCLDAGPKTAWKDMAATTLTTCSSTSPGQDWLVLPDGRIQVAGSTSPAECLDLQYMRATANNPVGLYQCAGLGNQGAKDKGINWPLRNVTA